MVRVGLGLVLYSATNCTGGIPNASQWHITSPPSAAYMRWCIGSAMIQIMVCRLFGANQCWVIVNWTIREKFQWNFNQNTKLFIQKNASEISSGKRRPLCPGGVEHRQAWRSPLQSMPIGNILCHCKQKTLKQWGISSQLRGDDFHPMCKN